MHLIIKALLGVATVSAAKKYVMEGSPCRKVSKKLKTSLVKEPLKPVEDLPEQFIWNDVNGVNYLTNIRN